MVFLISKSNKPIDMSINIYICFYHKFYFMKVNALQIRQSSGKIIEPLALDEIEIDRSTLYRKIKKYSIKV